MVSFEASSAPSSFKSNDRKRRFFGFADFSLFRAFGPLAEVVIGPSISLGAISLRLSPDKVLRVIDVAFEKIKVCQIFSSNHKLL